MNKTGTTILAGLLFIASPRLYPAAAAWSSQAESADKWHAVIFSDEGGNRFRLFYYGPDLRKPCDDEPKAFCAPLYELQAETPPATPPAFSSRQTDFGLRLRGTRKKDRKLSIRRAGKPELPFNDVPYSMDKTLGLPKGAMVVVKAPAPATPAAPKEPELGAYENAVLDSVSDADRGKYESEGCLKKEPAGGPDIDKRRRDCRRAIAIILEAFGQSTPDAAKFSEFEAAYIDKRLGAKAQKFRRLMEKAKKGKKPAEFVGQWRGAAQRETVAYMQPGSKKPEFRPDNLEKLLAKQFAQEFPLTAAIELVFQDASPAERAMIEYLANKPFYGSSRDKIHRAAKSMKPGDKPPADLAAKWREITLTEAKKRLEKDDPELASFLASSGVAESEFWAHFCGLLVSAPSAAQGSRSGGSFAGLKTAAKRSAQASGATLGEDASHGAASAVEPLAAAEGGVAGRCQESFNQAKLARLQNQPAATGKKGSEVEPPKPIGKDVGGSVEKKDDPNKWVNTIGGAKMGIWSGMVASFLGGPVGWAMLLGVGGLALGAWMTKDINR